MGKHWPRPSLSPPGEATIDLLAFVAELRRRWRAVAGTMFAGAGIAALLSWFTPPVYEATARLALIGRAGAEFSYVELIPRYRPLFDDPAVLQPVVLELALDGPPYWLTRDAFRLNAVSVETPQGSSLINVRVRLRDGVMAARAATALARRVADSALVLQLKDEATARAARKAEFEKAARLLTQAEEAWAAFWLRARPAFDREAEILARDAVYRELQAINREVWHQRAVRDMLAAAARTTRRKATTGARREHDLDQAWESLDRAERSRDKVFRMLEKQLDDLPSPAMPPELDQLKIERSRFERDFSHARRVRDDAEAALGRETMRTAGDVPRLQLVEPAPTPARPLARQHPRDVAVGLAAGLVVALTGVLLRSAVRESRANRS